ncbi:MAG: LytR C-terminal domain-containing protein [Actinobacteria bacterium]|jgi:hypothetical protein|nr:LytR C-terminal domain-containing protein [Acidimicrobiaceae bacterium]MBP6486120.1 LytR C-terminal domain-containing protein [Ilumatobacteraceae bacterium]NMD22750.1 LytR C-terminal domain-containing protein [Actinomycetota bacterium]MBK9970146.1 LytR C-terminal domain-containing protein [Acidimicrobiaceae bacterium]MBP7889021.1 LytR C-terminal domain-containing protein [Ilumatobacteraceae bacterium]
MSNDNAGRTGRTNGAAPMGSTVAIAVTLIALVLGFLILRKVNDDDSSGSSVKPSATTTTTVAGVIDPTITTVPVIAVTTTTAAALVTTGTKVQVANASTINGAAKNMSTAISAKGFSMAEPVNASEKLDISKVLYNADDPNAKAVADSLATVLGGIVSVAQGIPVPVASGNWGADSGVVLMLGNDYAGKTLAEIAGAAPTGVTVVTTV